MRKSEIMRKTNETDISLSLCLDGTGKTELDTGIGFLDHMLDLFAKHGRMDLKVKCTGDTYVDFHHSAEDIGIVLGQAFKEAVGDKKGIKRYGNMLLPMDESLVLASLDISGRAYLKYGLEIPTEKVGEMDTELIEEFFISFVRNADITLHIKQLDGTNSHHIIEAAFKAVARAIREAVSIDEKAKDEIPSSKGLL
ncbi:MAG: imidazoleglycerol-phosphate dehydratase HisB [Ruminococcaceae bacterium]|nr:imidazoleglycerol-phosphate dehydratase HisB [Oscillospiraceae bacterium]